MPAGILHGMAQGAADRDVSPRLAMAAAELDEDDDRAVLEALRSGVLGLGPRAIEFERACAAVAGTRYAVAVSSGTAALHLIVRALGVGPGDTLLVPSFTFAASVNAILYEGATPRFVDIEPDTFNVDPTDLEAKADGARGAMVVDVFGHPADWGAIEKIAARHDLAVIDDSCEAIGARYRERAAGSFGRAGAFAFYPNKQITTGEGGMIVTDDEDLAILCRSLRNQGRDEMGAWLHHERLGFNYRMDELSAALVVSQIHRLSGFLAKRAAVAARYAEMLAAFDWARAPRVLPNAEMSWFVYVVTLAEGIDRDSVMARMEAEGVPARAYFSPIHLQPYIRDRIGDLRGTLPVTEAIACRTLALPFHNNLPEAHAERVVRALEKAVRAAE